MTAAVEAASQWQTVDPERARGLVDARLQLHHAAQLATASGISYLPKRADDSHTNLEWLPAIRALAARVVPTPSPFRVAVQPSPFTLLLLDGRHEITTSLLLHGRGIADAAQWLRGVLPTVGADPAAFTLKRHFTIPPHRVDDGAAFDATDVTAFEELARWYGNAALVLAELASVTPRASEVRCWPHHFDIATLIEVEPARGTHSAPTVGVGVEPGDNYYAEPYFYVNAYPFPPASRATGPLGGGGSWHTNEWIGAVLPGSRLQATDQRAQLESFVQSAVRACTDLAKKSE
jgi:hypothetical protein